MSCPLRLGWLLIFSTSGAAAQQEPDREFRPVITAPRYETGNGPTVCLDHAHHNFHTLDNRFWAFGELLRRDGYVTKKDTYWKTIA